MTKHKLFLPGVSFVAGLVLWIIYLLWNGNASNPNMGVGIGFCLVIGAVFVYSAVQCRIATGGRLGNRIRAGVLLVMTLINFFQAGMYPAAILAIAGIIVGVMAYTGTDLAADPTES